MKSWRETKRLSSVQNLYLGEEIHMGNEYGKVIGVLPKFQPVYPTICTEVGIEVRIIDGPFGGKCLWFDYDEDEPSSLLTEKEYQAIQKEESQKGQDNA